MITDFTIGATVRLGTLHLPLLGPIQGPSLLQALAPKVTVGGHERTNQVLLSTWSQEDFRGGLGVERLDVERHSDRYWWGSLDTEHEKQTYLPRLAVAVNTGRPVGTRPRASAVYQEVLYLAWDAQIRYLDGSDVWQVPSEGSYTNLTANATDALALGLGTTDWLVFVDGQNVLKYNGTTWTLLAGNGTTVPLAKFAVEYDDKLWLMDSNNCLWETSDLVTFTKRGRLALLAGEATGLDVYFDPNGDPAIHAAHKSGLALYDNTSHIWKRTRLKFPRHAYGGRGHAHWRDDYFLTAGLSGYRYSDARTISPFGLDRDHGLPQDLVGNITRLADVFNGLVAGLTGEGQSTPQALFGGLGRFSGNVFVPVTAQAALYKWTGAAWHPLWVSDVAGGALDWLQYHTAGSVGRLWFHQGSDVYYVRVPASLMNPRQVPTWEFAATGELWTSRFDAGWAEAQKTGVEVTCRIENATATEYADLYYGLDNATAWTYLGRVSSPTPTTFLLATTPGQQDGLLWRDIRFRIVLARGSSPTVAPIFDWLVLAYVLRPDARFGYRFTVAVPEQGLQGLTAAEVDAVLDGYAREKKLLSFEFQGPTGALVTRRVMVTQWVPLKWGGETEQGRYQIAVAEA